MGVKFSSKRKRRVYDTYDIYDVYDTHHIFEATLIEFCPLYDSHGIFTALEWSSVTDMSSHFDDSSGTRGHVLVQQPINGYACFFPIALDRAQQVLYVHQGRKKVRQVCQFGCSNCGQGIGASCMSTSNSTDFYGVFHQNKFLGCKKCRGCFNCDPFMWNVAQEYLEPEKILCLTMVNKTFQPCDVLYTFPRNVEVIKSSIVSNTLVICTNHEYDYTNIILVLICLSTKKSSTRTLSKICFNCSNKKIPEQTIPNLKIIFLQKCILIVRNCCQEEDNNYLHVLASCNHESEESFVNIGLAKNCFSILRDCENQVLLNGILLDDGKQKLLIPESTFLFAHYCSMIGGCKSVPFIENVGFTVPKTLETKYNFTDEMMHRLFVNAIDLKQNNTNLIDDDFWDECWNNVLIRKQVELSSLPYIYREKFTIINPNKCPSIMSRLEIVFRKFKFKFSVLYLVVQYM